MSLLSLESVAKSFGHVVAVDGISFDVDRGQVVGFLGPNGAGKSTTMRMITQLFEPDRGEIRLDGVPLSEAGREAKRRIGYLPENNPLYEDMLVSEYLDFIATLRELAGPERVRAIDGAVHATAIDSVYYRPIGELSKGYRQRVGLAQAILHQPDLLILDEPTEGLDPNQRAEIRRLISELGKDRTVILSTHVLGEVQQTASRLLIIHKGRIAADGPVGQLMTQAEGVVQITVEALGSGIPEALRSMRGVRRVAEESSRDGRAAVRVFADNARDVRPEIFALAKTKGWTLYELHLQAGSLEDLFRQLTSEEGESARPAGAAGAAEAAGRAEMAGRAEKAERAETAENSGGTA
jgi:ABC-2 type transport system ATP-binding protein